MTASFIDTARIVCDRIYVTARCPSVCRSARLSYCTCHLSTAASCCLGFAAAGPAGRKYRSIAAATCRRSTVCSSKGEQFHVVSWRRKLKTDLLHNKYRKDACEFLELIHLVEHIPSPRLNVSLTASSKCANPNPPTLTFINSISSFLVHSLHNAHI